MKSISFAGALLAVGLSMALVGGCVTSAPPGAVFVAAAPPPAEIEVIGVAPGPDYVWIRGYHTWSGHGYVWNRGRWERRPRAGAVWVDGRWQHHSHGWFWTDGHWR